jgi:hypothetical protein
MKQPPMSIGEITNSVVADHLELQATKKPSGKSYQDGFFMAKESQI